ncbi:nicastrin-like [Actinia tenebrosa]|uniref:Nicastrin n=1 Tax=Actinia tenebrosa TaxID=6105 RepID=A0A6P8I7D1_ACTTE|nr:nicastrin-like [Actinia tenebrosa]
MILFACFSASMGGHVGVVHLIQSQDDIDWLIKYGDHSPYIPLFTSTMFNDTTLKVLVDKELINGAMVIFAGQHGHAPIDGFSPDVDCPNDRYGMYSDSSYGSCKKVKWNKKGNGMSFISYGIPVFALYDKDEVNELIKCFNDNNNPVNGSKPDFPLCGVELKDFMFAAKDTPTCMRKSQMPSPTQNQFCDPLGDYNVWGTLYPMMEKPNKSDIVVAAAKLDSSSFFHDMVHGAENDASGVIALLAAASALGEMKRKKSLPPPAKPIMFTLFQGESWDYIGSSRMVYDMENKAFPPNTWKVNVTGKMEDLNISTSDIGYILELNQVGLGTNSLLWAHSDPITRADKGVDSEIDKMFQILQKASKKANMSVEKPPKDQPLPPASLQQFLKSNKEIPGIVLTDHKAEFLNKYYNSRFDDALYVQGNFSRIENSSKIFLHNKFTERLTDVATTVANALYTLANDGKAPKKPLKADEDIVGHLVYCSFYRTDCSLFKSVFTSSIGAKLPASPLSRYVSVNTANNTLTFITHNLLLYFTGEHLLTKSCSSDKPHVTQRMRGTGNYSDDICVNGTVYYSVAESPAFLKKEYDSTEYSTWAESTWPADLSVRMFLISSPQRQAVTLASGIIITLFSFALVIFIHRKAELLFTPIDIPSNPDADS